MTNERFEALALPLFDSLYNYARWLARDASEAEDLVQETYLKALRGFDSFGAGTNFRAWIYRILRNTFLTSRSGLRAQAESVPIEEDTLIEENTPESVFMQLVDAQALENAIRELPLPFREVLLLCDVENMRYKEIAETLSIPVGTVTSRLLRARAKLRKILRGQQ
jgi:RNA polymerase sigma-70 factor, ECF subfamily